MKRFIVLCMLCFILAGCGGVVMNAEYATLLDNSAAWSAEVAERAEAGQMTPEEQTAALKGNAELWQQFVNAKNGVDAQ